MLLASLAASVLHASSIVDLGSFGGSTSYATNINNAGDVIGYAVSSGNDEAFYYNGSTAVLLPGLPGGSTIVQPGGLSQNGVMVGTAYAGSAPQAFLYTFGAVNLVDLGTLGGLDSWGYGVNDSSMAVGRSFTSGSPQDAFVYVNGSVPPMSPLGGTGTYGGYTYVEGDFINNNNQVAGNALGGQAFYYGSSYVALTLGGALSTATAMNDSGYVTGQSRLGSGTNQHAFVYSPTGGMQDLGTLIAGNAGNSDALAINDAGVAVGYSSMLSGQMHAFGYAGSVMTDLGTLTGFPDAKAVAINLSGEIVGDASTDLTFGTGNGSVEVPFLCMSIAACQAGDMINLNSLLPANSGWTLTSVSGINDSGAIIGRGTNSLGATEAFVLYTGTPEPSTVFSMLSGLLLCAAGVRFARHSSRNNSN
jgi:probable HAF family extracellular repeat protein